MRFWHSSMRVFRWVSYRSFKLLPGFMKWNVLLIIHFDDFVFDLPFRATSHICWMIAITIGTFCFVFKFMILMSSLFTFCTFWFVVAECFVVAIFLTIITTFWIWNVNFYVTNQEAPFDLRGYVWTINGQYVSIWRYQLPILSPLRAFNFGYTLWLQFILYVLFIHISQLFASNHTSWRIECSVGCHFNRNVNQFVSSEKIIAVGLFLKCTAVCHHSSALQIYMNLPFLWLLCAMRKRPFGLLNVWDCHLLLLRLKIVANCRWVVGEHGGDVLFLSFHAHIDFQ